MKNEVILKLKELLKSKYKDYYLENRKTGCLIKPNLKIKAKDLMNIL